MVPTVGRVVHYVLGENDGVRADKVGQQRPAIIVHVWNETCVQLQVFMDGTNDGERFRDCPLMWVTSVCPDQVEQKGRTWHWPERE